MFWPPTQSLTTAEISIMPYLLQKDVEASHLFTSGPEHVLVLSRASPAKSP